MIDDPDTDKCNDGDFRPTDESIHGSCFPSLKARVSQSPVDDENAHECDEGYGDDVG